MKLFNSLSRVTKSANHYALLLFIAEFILSSAILYAGEDLQSDTERIGDNDIHVVIGDQPVRGRPILPATETEFKLKLADTGDTLAFRWTTLEEGERKRVQRLYGLQIIDNRKTFGRKLKGVRLSLDNGKTIEGFPIPRNQFGQRALRTHSIPLMIVDEKEIKGEESFDMWESDIYTAREIYERIILEKPPGNNAAAHIEYAKTCANMELYKEALEHLKMATIIDPRVEERNKDFQMQCITENMQIEGSRQYDLLLYSMRVGDYFMAADILERLDKNFPNHPFRSRWEMLRAKIDEGTKAQLEKQVVRMSYIVAHNLIQKKLSTKVKIDDKGNIVASLPGKQVTTKQGHIFRGALVNQDDTELMIKLFDSHEGKVTNDNLHIKVKDIMTVTDVDLSVGVAEVNASYDELKTFVTDLESLAGLKMRMIASIAQKLKSPEEKVKEIFNKRLTRERTYDADSGSVISTPVYVSIHDAFWRNGSWLRDGSRPMPAPQMIMVDGQLMGGGNGFQSRQNSNSKSSVDPDKYPDLTDDPNIWWKFQSAETRLGILVAMAAEKVFTVKTILNKPCPQCSCNRVISISKAGGGTMEVRCPTCRGIGVLFHVLYW